MKKTANPMTISSQITARMLAIRTLLLVCAIAAPISLLATESDDIVAAIVTRSDVTVTFENDVTYPWTIVDNVVKNGNCGVIKSSSVLTMSYNSSYRTELSFDWLANNYNYHSLYVYVDGVFEGSTSSSSYSSKRFYVDAGQHVIAFKDSIGNSTSTSNYSYIKNIKIKEITPLENTVLSPNSQPLTFTNDGSWPWTVEDGYIQSSNYGDSYSASKFSTTFTIDKISKLSFDLRVTDDSYYTYNKLIISINGKGYVNFNYYSSFYNYAIALEPGTYTIEFKDTIYNSTAFYYSQLKNIELSSNVVEINMEYAGHLGEDVLYQVAELKDVELLKIKGNMNSADWAFIKDMPNLIAIDLSEANINEIPASAFSGQSRLSSVILPEGLINIGNSAFAGSRLRSINIPNSVETIGNSAFASSWVKKVHFGTQSHLKTIGESAFSGSSLQEINVPIGLEFIGYSAFASSSLQEFNMPNSVKILGLGTNSGYSSRSSTFSGCSSLKKIHFSDSLTTMGAYVCYECSNLSDVHLPNNLSSVGSYAFYKNTSLRRIDLPNSLSSIYNYAFEYSGLDSISLPLKLSTLSQYAFSYCDSLKYIELPSYIAYDKNFTYCPSIKTVVCRSATPPSITNDPFANSRARGYITLKVPSFAVVSYKLNSYWNKFRSIQEGDDIDYWAITGSLSLTNNRRMQGKPDIDIFASGKLTVGGNAPMEIGQFNIYPTGCLLNSCDAMTADSVNTKRSMSEDTWYFITPLHDVDLMKMSITDDASFVFRYYDGDSRATNGKGRSWRNVDNGKLSAGQGYIFQCNKAATITLPADKAGHAQLFRTQDVTLPLNAYPATASANANWNFVGNPYPCYYDIYYMDFTAPVTIWTGSTYRAYSIVDDNYVLSPMQAFFVQKPDAIDNIVFHKEGRQLSSTVERTSSANAARVSSIGRRHVFDLQIADDEHIDETRVVINDMASMDYEMERDASKFLSLETVVPQLFTIDANENGYAINERPIGNGTVKLAYYAGKSGFISISANRADGDIYLYDNVLNKTVNLMEQDYIFHSEPMSEPDSNRFTLKLNVLDLPDDIAHAMVPVRSSVEAHHGFMTIIANEGIDFMVYSVDGHQVFKGTTEGSRTNISLPAGSYLIKIGTSTYKSYVR